VTADPPPNLEPVGPFATARTPGDRLRRLSVRDLVLIPQAVVLLPLAALALDRWGLQRLQSRLLGVARRRRVPDPRAADDARKLAWIVDNVAKRGPWKANCLQRSLVLWWFLERRGIPAEIRIGVRRRPDRPLQSRELDFHAWVEHRGTVLNDRPDIRQLFATFDRAIAPSGARWR
jgi:hypothetical protein